MKKFAIKSPTGKLVVNSCREDRKTCIEDYIGSLIDLGFMVDRREWHGPQFYKKYWRTMRQSGYRVLRVEFEIKADPKSGWSWPECREVAA
jgi:hypothetical protein